MKLLFKGKAKRRDPTGTKSVQARPRPASSSSAVQTIDEASDQRLLNPSNTADANLSDPNNSNTDMIEELENYLMIEQARHLDELSKRSRRLEKVLSGLTKPGSSMQTKSPLKSIMNLQTKKASSADVSKYRHENDLLIQQAELLVQELTHANGQISELDLTVASLEKKTRKCKLKLL
jgi:hypothetical protein